jgi:cytochrome c oxidase subunit 2
MTSSPRTRPAPGFIAAAILVVVVLVVFALMAAAGADPINALRRAVAAMFPPPPATEQAREVQNLYTIVFAIAAVIFFIVEGLIVWSVIRYRRRPGDDELPPQTHGNNLAEITWTVVPTLIVAFLFFISWQSLTKVDALSATPDVHVQANAGQFQWTFDYLAADGQTKLFTQQVAGGPEGGMVVPVGKRVQLQLKSPDVIHAFYVPRFLFKRDVVPGATNRFDFTIDPAEAGQTYSGQCAELCGTGHRIMTFEVKAVTQAEFEAWVEQQIQKARATPSAPPSGPPGGGPPAGPPIELATQNIKFDKTAIEAPADQPFAIHFVNNDASIPHDVAIKDGSGAIIFNGEDVTGPGEATYNVPPQPAGSYTFVCTFHATMTGTLTVQ